MRLVMGALTMHSHRSTPAKALSLSRMIRKQEELSVVEHGRASMHQKAVEEEDKMAVGVMDTVVSRLGVVRENSNKVIIPGPQTKAVYIEAVFSPRYNLNQALKFTVIDLRHISPEILTGKKK